MTILTLQLKREFFDQIVSGEKTEEYREIRPRNQARYCILDEETELLNPKQYDQIKFITGQYKGARPFIIVEVLGAELVLLVDDNDKEITYIEDGQECVRCEIVYHLGKVVFNSENQ